MSAKLVRRSTFFLVLLFYKSKKTNNMTIQIHIHELSQLRGKFLQISWQANRETKGKKIKGRKSQRVKIEGKKRTLVTFPEIYMLNTINPLSSSTRSAFPVGVRGKFSSLSFCSLLVGGKLSIWLHWSKNNHKVFCCSFLVSLCLSNLSNLVG